MERALGAPTGHIDAFRFVVRGNVSAARRDAVSAAGETLGIKHMTIWSGPEFEEHLRLFGEDLLKRFCAGEQFPDDSAALHRFADDFSGLNDDETLRMMAAVFDRPAFRTPFHQESSLPAFLRAIEDTISAINTGVWRTREGEEIRRIPSLHHLRDPQTKASVLRAVQLVDQLRRTFVSGLRSGTIRPCGCHQADCPVFMLEDDTAKELDNTRTRALEVFRSAYGPFEVRIA